MSKLIKNALVYLLALSALTSCLSRVDKHGYMFDLADHHLLQSGITTKDRVLNIMGSPTVIADLNDDETWIYYAEDVKQMLFFKPDVVTRNIIAIKFDNSQTIKELTNHDISQESKLDFASNYTKVNSVKHGFFKSLFSNIGQVRPQ